MIDDDEFTVERIEPEARKEVLLYGRVRQYGYDIDESEDERVHQSRDSPMMGGV